jgi:tetratricopeptide (TPR) repeat protein
MSMPMQIEIPPALATLAAAIDSIAVPTVEAAIANARNALAAYDQLSAEQRAAYTHEIRTDIQTMKGEFDTTLNTALHAYPGNDSPDKAVELAQLAVQAGQPDLGHRLLQDAVKLGADEGSADVQALVAATPSAQVPLATELAATNAVPTANDVTLIGLERLANEDQEGAKAAFESAVDLDPDNPEHLNNLALSQLQAGLIRQAAEGALQALGLKPTLSPANLAVATVCLEQAVEWSKTHPVSQ